jgi:hypothetical protein
MNPLYLYAADIVAVLVLTFGAYFPRHRRRDLVVALLGVNIGVMAVASVLADSAIGAGLGLGLFGVLSIIRLRSSELEQTEIAYYFAALALGLLGGLPESRVAVPIGLMALIVGTLLVGGSPRLLARYRHQVLLLDRAFTEEPVLVAHLEGMLRATVHQVNVQRVDLVNDTTLVDVRFKLHPVAAAAPERVSA